TRRHLEVLHEVTADQVVAVAESRFRLTVGREKESRGLNAVTGKNKSFRASAELLAFEGANSHRLHRAQTFVRLDLDDVGVGVKMDVRRVDDLVPVLGAE